MATKRFIQLDETGAGRIVEEKSHPATPEELLALIGSQCKEVTASLTGVIPDGVLLVDAGETGGRFTTRNWGFIMRLPFLRLYGSFVNVRREDGSFCLIPQPVKVDGEGSPIPGGEVLSLDWTPPAPFGIAFAFIGGSHYAALINRSTRAAYRLPLGNCYCDGRMCMGGGVGHDPNLSIYENAQRSIRHFLSVKWTQDLCGSNDAKVAAEIMGFNPGEGHAQLLPTKELNTLDQWLADLGQKLGLKADMLAGIQSIDWGRELP